MRKLLRWAISPNSWIGAYLAIVLLYIFIIALFGSPGGRAVRDMWQVISFCLVSLVFMAGFLVTSEIESRRRRRSFNNGERHV